MPIAFAVFAFVMGLAIIASFVSVRIRQVALDVSGHVVTFANYVASVEKSADLPIEPILDLPYLEIADLYASFAAMVSRLSEAQRREAEHGKLAAIASTTQMLAHDVRKHFSILRMGLAMLGSAKDPASVKKVLSRLVPEIDKAVSSVDGLIADVMEIGSSSNQLIQEPASPESLIEATLAEVFRVYPKAQISLSYDLQHTHMANVHIQKASRVFSNIVGNAVQAMGLRGEMWFKTIDRDGFIVFCLGNAGSVIPQESLPKLFDAFFTSGKKGGTGLGLAIAQKVVTAHGGQIWCESAKTEEHPEGKVEFFFSLPAIGSPYHVSSSHLPIHSSQIINSISLSNALDEEKVVTSVSKAELELEADIISLATELARPINILIVDDEAVYREGLHAALSRAPAVLEKLKIEFDDSSSGALDKMVSYAYDLIISDVDLGNDSLNGFELVSEIRKGDNDCFVCVHSNRVVAADHKTAIASGADAFLPKPMAREHLLKIVIQAGERSLLKIEAAEPEVELALPQPEVLVVDDNIFILEAWEDMLRPDAKVYTAAGIDDLHTLIAKDVGLVARLTCVVTDMHLDDQGDGFDVGRLVKGMRSDLPVLLSSDGVFETADLAGAVNAVIAKQPVTLAALVGRAVGAGAASLH